MPSREIANSESAMRGEKPGAEQFFELGKMYSTGRCGSADMVSAHKWLNIAAMCGFKDARPSAPRDRGRNVRGQDCRSERPRDFGDPGAAAVSRMRARKRG